MKQLYQPRRWSYDNLIIHDDLSGSQPITRPEAPKNNLKTRLKLAWGVLVGTYDVLDWEEDL